MARKKRKREQVATGSGFQGIREILQLKGSWELLRLGLEASKKKNDLVPYAMVEELYIASNAFSNVHFKKLLRILEAGGLISRGMVRVENAAVWGYRLTILGRHVSELLGTLDEKFGKESTKQGTSAAGGEIHA